VNAFHSIFSFKREHFVNVFFSHISSKFLS
jgi:hypothetical protein